MQIDSKKQLLTLTGKTYETPEKEPLTLGMVIAEALASSETAGKMKSYILAKKFYDQTSVEIDAADLSVIKKSVEACRSYNNLILGQTLSLLEEIK